MDRLSVFYSAKNEAGYVQAVIVADDLPVYEALGFVTSIDDLKPIEDKGPGEPPAPDSDAKASGSKASKKAADNGDDTDKG
ncbi:TPA: hypothetical protein JD369_000311 [Citrobacter freundii]|nr:hypothetical protein [Citrobacter freundii]